MISCGCGLIHIWSLMLESRTSINTMKQGIRVYLLAVLSVEVWGPNQIAIKNIERNLGAYAEHPDDLSIERLHCSRNNNNKFYQSELSGDTYQRMKTFIYYCVFMIPISIIIHKNQWAFCSGSPKPQIGISESLLPLTTTTTLSYTVLTR